MRLSTLLFAILLTAALALAGCQSDNGDDDLAVTPTPEQTNSEVPEDEEPTAEVEEPTPDVAETPESDEPTPDDEDASDPLVLEPPAMFLVTESGEQEAQVGAFFWIDAEAGYAMEVDSQGFAVHEEPLTLQVGEDVRFETEGDKFPHRILLEVYSEEENTTEDIPTRVGRMTAFVPETEPLYAEEFDTGDDLSWTVDLEPGDYYVRLETYWATPEEIERDGDAEFSFRIRVG